MTLSLSNPNPSIQIVDIIPQSDSAEFGQNSEPSFAIDPLDPSNIIAGAFTPTSTAYFLSTDGGTTWSDFGTLSTRDKSIAWTADGSAVLTATLRPKLDIALSSGTTSSGNFGSPIFTFEGFQKTHNLDQPWIRTGPSDHVYIAYNDLGVTNGETASVLVSTDNGSTFTPVTLDRIGSPPSVGQDAPSVRLAVDDSTGSTGIVYAAFTRWTSFLGTDSAGNDYFGAQVVVVRSDNGGTDGFNQLGSGGNGVSVNASSGTSQITSVFSNRNNSDITLGQERTGGDLAIAVDPNNPNHVVVAYGSAGDIGSGQLQLVVAESFDGGADWSTKFTTDASTRSALPALAISADGTIGLLYGSYNPSTNDLSQHFLTTTNDFATPPVDSTLAVESNASPTIKFNPYIGDFFDLTAVGNTFEGTFSASNADNGTSALFSSNVSFQRDFTGTPGMPSFTLTNKTGHAVSPSIDPFFFSFTPNADNPVVSMVSSPSTASDLGGLSAISNPSMTTGMASTHLLVQAMASFGSHSGIIETHIGNLADSLKSQDFLAAGSQVHH